jgi:hypothetical protein
LARKRGVNAEKDPTTKKIKSKKEGGVCVLLNIRQTVTITLLFIEGFMKIIKESKIFQTRNM